MKRMEPSNNCGWLLIIIARPDTVKQYYMGIFGMSDMESKNKLDDALSESVDILGINLNG